MLSFGRCDIGCTGVHDGVIVKRKATMRTFGAAAVALARSAAMWACIAAYGCERQKESLIRAVPFPAALLNFKGPQQGFFFLGFSWSRAFPCVAWTGLYYRCAANGIKR